MKNITTVILDIGKVLVEFDWQSYIKSFNYSETVNEELGKLIFLSPIWKERDRGDKTEEEYKELIISQAPHLEKEIQMLFSKIVDIVEVYPFSYDWIQSLKEQGKKVYLLSNYSKVSFEHDISKFDFLKLVDGKVISYEVNHVKPELEIYEILLKKYNINPWEAVFLDDVEENLESAKVLGINTIHVTSHAKALEALKILGIE